MQIVVKRVGSGKELCELSEVSQSTQDPRKGSLVAALYASIVLLQKTPPNQNSDTPTSYQVGLTVHVVIIMDRKEAWV